jgi:hypothetical protein
MVYNTITEFLDFFTPSGILRLENTAFRKQETGPVIQVSSF